MAVNPVSFQPLSFQQASPLTSGMQVGSEVMANAFKNALMRQQTQAQQIQNQYMPQDLQAKIQGQLLQNTQTGIQNTWLPRTDQADVSYKNAQTDLTNQQTKFYPLETLIKAQAANQSLSRFGGAYQLSKALEAMAPAAREAWVAQNQDVYNIMLSNLGNKDKTNQSFITPQIMAQYFPQLANPQSSTGAPQPGAAVPQPGAAAQPNVPIAPANNFSAPPSASMGGYSYSPIPNGALNAGAAAQPNAQAQPSAQPYVTPGMFKPATPDQTNQVQLANQMSANKALTTNATQRQMEGAVQVEDIMNSPDFQRRAQNAAQYAGAVGKGAAAVAALSQQNPQAYEDSIAFKNQDMTLLQNRIKTLDQMGATDAQREALDAMYTKTMDALTSNPAQFITQLNNLQNALSTVAKSVQKSASPIFPVNRLSGAKPISQPGKVDPSLITDENLQYTAKINGLTVAQVKQKMGIK